MILAGSGPIQRGFVLGAKHPRFAGATHAGDAGCRGGNRRIDLGYAADRTPFSRAIAFRWGQKKTSAANRGREWMQSFQRDR